jgi:hypothetical protein
MCKYVDCLLRTEVKILVRKSVTPRKAQVIQSMNFVKLESMLYVTFRYFRARGAHIFTIDGCLLMSTLNLKSAFSETGIAWKYSYALYSYALQYVSI